MSCHIISYHIISYISYSIISYHITSYHVYHIVSYHIPYHIIYIMSYHITSYHIYHIVSYHTIPYHIIYHIICNRKEPDSNPQQCMSDFCTTNTANATGFCLSTSVSRCRMFHLRIHPTNYVRYVTLANESVVKHITNTYRKLLSSLSSVSPLCRVSTLIFLRQTISLGNIALQLFWCYYSWSSYR